MTKIQLWNSKFNFETVYGASFGSKFHFFIKFWILILSPRSALFPCLMWRRKIFSTKKKRDYCQGSTDRWHSTLLLSSWFFWPWEIWPVGTSLTTVCGSLTIAKNMQKLLGKINGPKNIRHTPTIAVIGSGGGFRAMTGTGIHGLVPSSIKSQAVLGSLKKGWQVQWKLFKVRES